MAFSALSARNYLFFFCFAVFTVLFAQFLLHLDINKRSYNHVPGECGIIPNLPGIRGLATTNAGRLYLTVNSKETGSENKHLFTFYSDNRTARELHIEGTPKKWKIRPGTMGVSSDTENPTAFVYNEATKDVEMFETNELSDSWKYLKTLKSTRYEGLTDLCAAGPTSFYFIQPSIFGSWLNLLERIIPAPTGQVLFANGKRVQLVMHISAPTGIVYDRLKRSIFVTSFARNSIYVVKMAKGHHAETVKEFNIGCSPTSIWKDFDGSFLVTCQPVRFRYILNFLKVTTSTPSMILRIVVPVTGDRDVTITQLYSNDGATISGANFTVRAGRSLMISNSDKILNCQL